MNVSHRANRDSSITNVSGPPFTWRTSFGGSQPYLVANGKGKRKKANDGARHAFTYVDLQVEQGPTVTAAR